MKAFPFYILSHLIIIVAFLASLPYSNMPENFVNGQIPPILEYETCFLLFKLGFILYLVTTPFLLYENIYYGDKLTHAIISKIFVPYKPFEYAIDNIEKKIKIKNPFHKKHNISHRYLPEIIKVKTKDNRKLFLKWSRSNVEALTYDTHNTAARPSYKKMLTFFTTFSHKPSERIDMDNIKEWKPYDFDTDNDNYWSWNEYANFPVALERD